MPTFGSLMAQARRRMGLQANIEQAPFTDPLFYDRVNEILRAFAHEGGYREEFTLNLSGSSAVHALSSRVVQVIENTVRVDWDGSGAYATTPCAADEDALRARYGVLEIEAASIPEFYYTQRGATADAMLNLVFFPRSDTARTSGVKFWARCAPAAVTGPSTSLPVQDHEVPLILPGLCLALAEAGLSAGLTTFNDVGLWEGRWERALRTYADTIEDSQRSGPRTVHQTNDDDY